jgi:tryptophan 7-halogenase
MMIHSILVLGNGPEALLAALVLQKRLEGIRVVWLRCQATEPPYLSESIVARPFHRCLQFNAAGLWTSAKPTMALGVRMHWGPRERFHFSYGMGPHERLNKTWPKPIGYYCGDFDADERDIQPALMAHDRLFARQNGAPVIHDAFAYQFTGPCLEQFLRGLARERGLEIFEGHVQQAPAADGRIPSVALASGPAIAADLYVDATGPGALLLGGALQEPFADALATLPCDRVAEIAAARVGPMVPAAVSRTLAHGWTWETHHMNAVGHLHAYNSQHISDEEAVAHLTREAGPILQPPVVRSIRPGRRQRVWVGNVIALGAAGACAGPLHATRLDMVLAQATALAETVRERHLISPSQIAVLNKLQERQFECLRGLMATSYQLNDRVPTAFWDQCRAISDIGPTARILQFYRENGPSAVWAKLLLDPADIFNLNLYYSTFLAFKVPFHSGHTIAPRERQLWGDLCAANRAAGQAGFAPAEALAAIHTGHWQLATQ